MIGLSKLATRYPEPPDDIRVHARTAEVLFYLRYIGSLGTSFSEPSSGASSRSEAFSGDAASSTPYSS